MPQPDFTPSERQIIHRVEDPHGSNVGYELGYLVPSALLVAFGFAYDANAAFAAAFAVIATFRAYDIYHARAGLPLLRSVLQKYRDACARD